MGMILLLLLALVLFGLGFALKILWWVAFAIIAVWLFRTIRPTRSSRVNHSSHR